MMPKAKPLLTVSDEFIKSILEIIFDESESGKERMVAAMRAAQVNYNGSWGFLVRTFLGFATRNNQITFTTNMTDAISESLLRAEYFNTLTNSGGWKVNSYNYNLFIELIKLVQGYEPLSDDTAPLFVLKLNEEITKKIKEAVVEDKLNQKRIADRTAELEKTQQNVAQSDVLQKNIGVFDAGQQSINNTLICNNLDAAKDVAAKQLDKIVFCLLKNPQWSLQLVDVTGGVHLLTLGVELKSRLANQKGQDVEQFKLEHIKLIKKECIKAKDLTLDKVKLHVNPEGSVEALVQANVRSAFVLQHVADKTTLYWISMLGQVNKQSLDAYPQLHAWLTAHPAPLNAEATLQLKTCLMLVNIAKSINPQKLKVIEDVLAKRNGDVLALAKEEGASSAGKLNLNAFGKIALIFAEPKLAKPLPRAPGQLDPKQQAALSQLPLFWSKKAQVLEATNNDKARMSANVAK